MSLKISDYPISIKSLNHLFEQLLKNKSPLRLFHNFFLKNITINGKVIDLGSGSHASYYNFLNKKNANIYYADQNKKKSKRYFKVNLEKRLIFKDKEFDTVILFNVIEHVENYSFLINETFRILRKGGKLELFVPFMFRYHEDPKDYFRPSHYYITKILKESGYKVNTYLIGVGPVKVISEIILKYFKIHFLKIFFLITLLFLDKLINLFSKDYINYYCGIHCSCEK
jgi:SAM-dependent methyltransferase